MFRSFLTGFFLSLLAVLGGLIGIHVWCGDELPSLAKVREVETSLRTEVYDRNGQLLATLSREDRSYVGLQDVAPHFVRAILATEDRGFFRHWGVDPIGLARAIVHNLSGRDGGRLQGGSTITQQLAWNLFLTHEQTINRKLKELVMTLRLERTFSKDEILELYVNEIYYGEGTYGVETAARTFFGKSAAELSLAESAVLAGIPKHPARFSPIRNPENSKARRNVVLSALRSVGAIRDSAYQAAVAESLHVVRMQRDENADWLAPYFVETIRRHLIDAYGSETTYEGGLRVMTTLDYDLQYTAEFELERQLQNLEVRNDYDYLAVADSDTVEAERLQGAVTALDVRTGAVLVLVGGRDFAESEFNRVTQARRQPGSAFKPFVYAAAIESGKRANDVLVDEPIVRFMPSGDRWAPTNFSHEFRGLVTLRQALNHSINIPAVLLLEDVGFNRTIDLARRLGVESPLPRVLSLALGTGEMTLLELTAAYGPFANRGIFAEPYMIEHIEDSTGREFYSHRPDTHDATDEQVAYLVSDLLRSVVDRGTGRNARLLGLEGPAAGKTGTTDDYADAWFIGYNPNVVVGTWVGFDQKIPIGRSMTGATCALPVWTAVLDAHNDAYGVPDELPPPSGIVRASVCAETGRLSTNYCENVTTEVFIRNSAPRLPCPLHTAPDPLNPFLHGDEFENGTEDSLDVIRPTKRPKRPPNPRPRSSW